jgi:hypothetical protein
MASKGVEASDGKPTWFARTREAFVQAGIWLGISAIALVVLGYVAPHFARLAEEVRLSPTLFAFLGSVLAVGLATWRGGREKAQKITPILSIIGFGSIVMMVNSWDPVCIGGTDEWRAIPERQGRLIEMWSKCVYDDDGDACQRTMTESEQLEQLQRRRDALFRRMCD